GPELAVIVGAHEIAKSDEFWRLDQRPAVQRHPGHLDERVDGEGEHEEKRRRHVDQPEHPAASTRMHAARILAIAGLEVSSPRDPLSGRAEGWSGPRGPR